MLVDCVTFWPQTLISFIGTGRAKYSVSEMVIAEESLAMSDYTTFAQELRFPSMLKHDRA